MRSKGKEQRRSPSADPLESKMRHEDVKGAKLRRVDGDTKYNALVVITRVVPVETDQWRGVGGWRGYD